MISKTHIQLAQLGAGALIALAAAALEPGLAAKGSTLLYGAVWLALAWRCGLPPLLVSALVLLAARMPLTDGLPASALLAACLGLGAWTLAVWSKHRAAAAASGLLWGALAVCMPALWPLAVLGFPRLGKVYGEEAKWARTPGIVLLVAGLGLVWWLHGIPEVFQRFVDPDHYGEWLVAFEGLLTRERLWLALPLAGVFEVAQGHPEDLRMTWRNLLIPGFLLALLWLSPALAPALLFWVALPVASLMLARWTYALPGWPPRVAMWMGLGWFALPLLTGGGA